MTTHPNDPAFACRYNELYRGDDGNIIINGMTKREYFAGLALQGLLALPTPMMKVETITDVAGSQRWTKLAVLMADALIDELNRKDK